MIQLDPGPKCEHEPFYATIQEACGPASSTSWNVRVTSSGFFATARPEGRTLPPQGWKIHLAAGTRTARTVLDRALPVLVDARAAFKVVTSVPRLAALNEGRFGLSQIGKFVTVYPVDDAEAIAVAGALRAATHGLRGPRVPSDRTLCPGSVVSYRYGSFDGRSLRTPLGEHLPAMNGPDGALVPDRRGRHYLPPSWVADPFVAAGIAPGPREPDLVIGDRYAVVARLHWSPRSEVHLCLDSQTAKKCVVKRVQDAGDGEVARARAEAAFLNRFSDDPRIPRLYDVIDDEQGVALVMDDLDGQTLEQHVGRLRQRNALPGMDDVIRWGAELADILAVVHAAGVVHNDVKAANVLLTPGDAVCLIDFGVAEETARSADPAGRRSRHGTRGHMSPQHLDCEPAATADDLFGLGALLYGLVTGADPTLAPDPSDLMVRPLRVMNPEASPCVAKIVSRCLHPDPTVRCASAAEVRDVLRDVGIRNPLRRRSTTPVTAPSGDREHRALALSYRLGTLLISEVREHERSSKREENESTSAGSTDLHDGLAGVVLALAELVASPGGAPYRDALRDGARLLRDAPAPARAWLAGLYVGAAGSALALLRAGEVLGDDDLVAAALSMARDVAAAEHRSPDIFNGTAGRLRCHLWIWDVTGDEEHLDHARAAGDHLMSIAHRDSGTATWTMPAGYGSLSGRRLTGYAHGAAGIADALLDLFRVSGEQEVLDTVLGAARWLEGLAMPALGDGSGLNWPSAEGGRPSMAFWCHGAAGIDRFLLNLGCLGEGRRFVALAERTAPVLSHGARWAGPSQCHGLAGMIEGLLDLYTATTDPGHLDTAWDLAQLLGAFVLERNGRAVVTAGADRCGPGFSTGSAGIVACLVRLANGPGTHLLAL